jgi:exocyst complex component 3
VDRFWLEKKDLTGFSPPDRPRQWEKFCFELLKKSVKDRIEGNQLETREEHKYWLRRHLEMCRKRFLKDFQIITKVCHRIFPKHYDIVNRFLDYYHNCLKEYLTEICDPKRRTENDTLTTAEIYAIFTFIRDYHGAECLGNPELNLDISQLSPLLEKDVLSAIIDVFINDRKEKFTEWTRKIVSLEVKDWHTRKEVELTAEHYYMTTMPRMLMNMIIETLDMAKQMSNETCQLILYMVIQKLNEFRDLYVTEMNNYATRYFNNRDEFRENFTKQMIANANNCESIPYSMLIIREKYDQSQLFRYESVGKKFQHTAEYCCEIIIQEMEIDTGEFLKFLFTRNWLGSAVNPYCRRILEITQNYWNSKLTHLKKPLLAYLFHTWHKRILAYYLRNLFSRTTTIKLTTPLERRTCAEQLRREAAMLEKEFILWDGTSAENATKYHFNILSNMADILEQTDLDYIGFDIGILAKKYPSLTIDQIQRVLLLRGDLSKQQAKDKADAALANMPRVNEGILFEIMEIVNQLNQRSLK